MDFDTFGERRQQAARRTTVQQYEHTFIRRAANQTTERLTQTCACDPIIPGFRITLRQMHPPFAV